MGEGMKVYVADGWHWRRDKPILKVYADYGRANVAVRRMVSFELVHICD
jgi:hypothetical protein